MSSRKELANAIRALSMDAVQKAKSGHPGAPMGMADIAEVLWRDFLNHNPLSRRRFLLIHAKIPLAGAIWQQQKQRQ
jgi:transketolase